MLFNRFNRFNKKASLEISIQAIVIVVLAMTLLGLGLGFIKKQFGGLERTTLDVTTQVRNQITDQLVSGDKKMALSTNSIEINKGSTEDIVIGIQNKDNDIINYKINFEPVTGPDGIITFGDNWFQFDKEPKKLNPTESNIRKVRLLIPTDTKSGSYLLKVQIINDGVGVYDEADFFVTVRG